jgi:DNA-binding response OmpR family regulator
MVSLLKTLLGMEGYQVVTLLDKKGDIIENMCKEKGDVLLIDVYLGDRNGCDIVRQVRSNPDLMEMKILMASGIDRSEDCFSAGADDFLLKPYMPEELFRKLKA